MSNLVTVVGTVATDPRLIKTQSGVDLCTFRVASGDRRFDREQQKWVDGETNWFGITTFRAMADHALQSFSKGERVIVTGRLRLRRWENGEKSGLSADIEADAIGHDVRWGVSRFEKRTANGTAVGGQVSGDAAGGQADGEGIAQERWGAPSEESREEGEGAEQEERVDEGSSARVEAYGDDGFVPAAA